MHLKYSTSLDYSTVTWLRLGCVLYQYCIIMMRTAWYYSTYIILYSVEHVVYIYIFFNVWYTVYLYLQVIQFNIMIDMNIKIYNLFLHTHAHPHTRTHTHTVIHKHTHTRTHARTHTRTHAQPHAHTYTHMLTNRMS